MRILKNTSRSIMRKSSYWPFVGAVLTWAVFVAPASAQDDETKDATFQRWLAYYQDVADAYEFYVASDSDNRLKVSPKPIMFYTHPSTTRGTHGAFFVWTRRGRPEVVGSIWSEDFAGGTRTVMHEFHSLALEPLTPVQVGRYTWAPKLGIELKLIPGAQPPKQSASLRLAQMRSMAQEFVGYSTPQGREMRLRTLRQPLYRYESEDPEVLDGAVFGMFLDWDPEIMLLIEARKAGDVVQWHFGAGRFNCPPLRVTYQGSDVWNAKQTMEAYPRFGDPESTFLAVHQVDRRDAVTTEAVGTGASGARDGGTDERIDSPQYELR
jgi:hypothetical protein